MNATSAAATTGTAACEIKTCAGIVLGHADHTAADDARNAAPASAATWNKRAGALLFLTYNASNAHGTMAPTTTARAHAMSVPPSCAGAKYVNPISHASASAPPASDARAIHSADDGCSGAL